MNDNIIEQTFKNKEYCIAELHRIREAWGYKDTFTPAVIDASRNVLAMMLLYAPEEILDMVSNTLDELIIRERMVIFAPLYKKGYLL
jgi:hypothetical protein